MAVESPPWALNAGTYTAEQTRRAVFSWAGRTAANTPGIVSGGLYSSTDCQATAPGSGLSVNISTGEILIPGTEGGVQGPGYGRVSSTTNVAIATANASNPRIDIVCATMSDAQYTEPTGGSGSQWAIQAVTGTPTVGATLTNLSGAPTLPLSSLLLCYVLVPASAANIITADISNRATVVQPQSVSGRLIARQFYTPANTSITVIIGVPGSASQALDTTNLTLSFVAPNSGAVIVRLQGFAVVTATNYQVWYLVTHGTTSIIGNPQIALGGTSGAALAGTQSTDILLTGLTPGTAYQCDWAAAASNTGVCSVAFGAGGTTPFYGPGVMEAFAA